MNSDTHTPVPRGAWRIMWVNTFAFTVCFAARGTGVCVSVSAGRELFVTNCASCHGAQGRGDGESQSRDWRTLLISPRNLSAGEFKVGGSSEDLYTRISLGVPGGAGMQLMMNFSFLTEEERWAIVHFLEAKILPAPAEGR